MAEKKTSSKVKKAPKKTKAITAPSLMVSVENLPPVEDNDTIYRFKEKVNGLYEGIGDLTTISGSTLMEWIDTNANTEDLQAQVDANTAGIATTQNNLDIAAEYIYGNATNIATLNTEVAGLSGSVGALDSAVIDLGQQIIDTTYVHPTDTAGQVDINTNQVISKMTVNELGHVTAVSKRVMTPAHIGAQPAAEPSTRADSLLCGDGSYNSATANTATANKIVQRGGSGEVHGAMFITEMALPTSPASPLATVCGYVDGGETRDGVDADVHKGAIHSSTMADFRTNLYSEFIVCGPKSLVQLGASGAGWAAGENLIGQYNLPGWIVGLGQQNLLISPAVPADGSFYGIATTGDVAAGWSDMRLKTKVGSLDNALDKVCSLEGFLYEGSELSKQYGIHPEGVVKVGLSAQDVQKVLPEVITMAPMNMEHDTDFLNVDYAKMVPLLVEAIKELKVMTLRLKVEVATLKSRA